MKEMKKWALQNKLIMTGIGIIFVILLLIAFYLHANKQTEVSVKQEKFIIEVNEEIKQEAYLYLDGIDENESAFYDFTTVDTKKLGYYEGKIIYKDVDYKIYFEVVDTHKPEIKISGDHKFVFDLNTSLEDVTDLVNSMLSVSDNYEKEFDILEVVNTIPNEEIEYIVKITAKDSSGNESIPMTITIQFTENGKEKNNLKQEEISITLQSKEVGETIDSEENQQENSSINVDSADQTDTSSDNSNDSHIDEANKANTTPIVTPIPEQKPEPKPEVVYPIPGVNKTEEELLAEGYTRGTIGNWRDPFAQKHVIIVESFDAWSEEEVSDWATRKWEENPDYVAGPDFSKPLKYQTMHIRNEDGSYTAYISRYI